MRKVILAVLLSLGLIAGGAGIAMADSTPNSHHVHVVSVDSYDAVVGWDAIGSTIPVEIEVWNPTTNVLIEHYGLTTGHSTGWTVPIPCYTSDTTLDVKVNWTINGIDQGWSNPVGFTDYGQGLC